MAIYNNMSFTNIIDSQLSYFNAYFTLITKYFLPLFLHDYKSKTFVLKTNQIFQDITLLRFTKQQLTLLII